MVTGMRRHRRAGAGGSKEALECHAPPGSDGHVKPQGHRRAGSAGHPDAFRPQACEPCQCSGPQACPSPLPFQRTTATPLPLEGLP